MNIDSTIWFDKNKRQEQLDEHITREGKARFGSEELDESQKAERVRRHFNSVAAKYDMMNTLLSMGIHYLWKYQGVRMLGLKSGDKVLDVCGGTGDLSILAEKITGPSGKVILYDINREMIKAGREKSSNTFHRKRIVYVQGDAEQISFPDNTFDAVMVGFAIRNITHMKQAFREMHRVLKPGGRFLCLEFSKPIWPWFRFLYDVYSFHIMPFLGDLLVGSKTAYTCLPETIRLFLLPDELSEVFRESGFSEVKYRLLTNGIAVAHTGKKQQRH
ncbi:MAG: bifunctional demethylmenaquinone methyltransferase/2-methoxy-6-polyprenyl-1,4-benzoquinol methylase UbiE [Desulfococcaceae bacterium]